MSTSSGASTGENVEAETAELAKAQEVEAGAQDDLDAVKLKLNTNQEELAKAVSELAEAKKARRGTEGTLRRNRKMR